MKKLTPKMLKHLITNLLPKLPGINYSTKLQGQWYYDRIVEILEYRFPKLKFAGSIKMEIKKQCKEYAFTQHLLQQNQKTAYLALDATSLTVNNLPKNVLSNYEIENILFSLKLEPIYKIIEALGDVKSIRPSPETNIQPPKRRKWDIPK